MKISSEWHDAIEFIARKFCSVEPFAGTYFRESDLDGILPFHRNRVAFLRYLEHFGAIGPKVSGHVVEVMGPDLATLPFVDDRREILPAIVNLAAAPIADDRVQTIAGDIVLRNELTEEDRTSSEWAAICGFSDDTFLNRTRRDKPGETWRVVEGPPQRYRVHVEDLPVGVRGSKKQRDERLKAIKG